MGLQHLKAPVYASGNVFRRYQKNLNSHFIFPHPPTMGMPLYL